MVTQGGAYIFQLMDFYGASGIPILWCCFFQTIAIGWIYGVNKFASNVEQMTGKLEETSEYKPYCIVLTVLYCIVLTVLYCIVLECTLLYCTVLYYIVLYCTILYCTAMYYTVLYCTVL